MPYIQKNQVFETAKQTKINIKAFMLPGESTPPTNLCIESNTASFEASSPVGDLGCMSMFK